MLGLAAAVAVIGGPALLLSVLLWTCLQSRFRRVQVGAAALASVVAVGVLVAAARSTWRQAQLDRLRIGESIADLPVAPDRDELGPAVGDPSAELAPQWGVVRHVAYYDHVSERRWYVEADPATSRILYVDQLRDGNPHVSLEMIFLKPIAGAFALTGIVWVAWRRRTRG